MGRTCIRRNSLRGGVVEDACRAAVVPSRGKRQRPNQTQEKSCCHTAAVVPRFDSGGVLPVISGGIAMHVVAPE